MLVHRDDRASGASRGICTSRIVAPEFHAEDADNSQSARRTTVAVALSERRTLRIHPQPNKALMIRWRDLSAHMERSGFFRWIRGNPGPAVEQLEQPCSRAADQRFR